MLEQMLIENTTNKSLKYLIDISFDTLALGSKAIVDLGTAGLTYSTVGTGSAAGVVNDPTMGQCFYFDGTYGFLSSDFLTKIGKISNKHIQLEVAFKQADSTPQYRVFSTGDYVSTQHAGFAMILNTNSRYITLFNESGGSYAFQYFTDPYTSNWDSLVVTRQLNGSTTNITNLRTGTSVDFAAFNTGGDSWFRVAHTLEGGHYFKGWLKYLRIADLNAQ